MVDLVFRVDTTEVNKLLNAVGGPGLNRIFSRALNRASLAGKTLGSKEIRKRYKLNAGFINKKHITVKKSRPSSLQSSIRFSGNRIGLIHFVKGKKAPIRQKGIKVSKRRKLRVQIRPGGTFTPKGRFIAFAKNATNVFSRTTKHSLPLTRSSVPSVGAMLTALRIDTKITARTNEIFFKTYNNDFNRLIS